ncbi:unnamed protein product [Cylicocyclus nassatus]|uniref:Uncharacterized protein n=1 Tax=Cylicocyclus nassatus TaxID=53992 RepID=A0AA36GXH3_CYLNA|nr:unnamed protein product [Cylicocyclus nassatus]
MLMHFWTIFISIQLLFIHVHLVYVYWKLLDDLKPGAEDGTDYQAVYVFELPLVEDNLPFSCDFDFDTSVKCKLKYIEKPPSDDNDFCRVVPVYKSQTSELRCRRRKDFLYEKDWIKATLEDFMQLNGTSDRHKDMAACIKNNLNKIHIPPIRKCCPRLSHPLYISNTNLGFIPN